MPSTEPTTQIDHRYGDAEAVPTPWSTAQEHLAAAEVAWLSTVRPDGRPHVTPLLTVWLDGALHICTGEVEQKARNIAANPQVVLTTGTNALHGGLDLSVEGRAERVTDPERLQVLANAWEKKYGSGWHFEVRDGGFEGGHALALVFRIEPATVFGFGKGPYSQTRWCFTGS
jgi:nitroimidazol reductase NimA-like FMN-containing flavoprotein (pyridoxamine 5'-phosphate oxidase superfamily)